MDVKGGDAKKKFEVNHVFKNLAVKWQLTIGFAGVVALFIATIVTIGLLLVGLTHSVGDLNEESLPLALAVDEMDLSRSEVQQFLTDVSATHDPAGYKDAQEPAIRFEAVIAKFKQHFTAIHDTTKLQELESIESHFKSFYSLGKSMAETYVKDGMDAGNALMKGSNTVPGFDKASEVLSTQLACFRKEQISNAQQASSNAFGSSKSIQNAPS